MQNTLILTSPITLPKQTEKVLAGFLVVFAVISIINAASLLQPVQALDVPSQDEKLLMDLTNLERANYGLKPLAFNAKLSEAAEAKAADMFKDGYFEHFSPAGKTPWMFIENAGYRYLKAGENLAIDFQSVEGPVPAWMNSPTHRANILKSDYQEIGIAQVKGTFKDRETTIVVQMFGTQALSIAPVLSVFSL